MSNRLMGQKKGQSDGHRLGYQYGYHYGRCEAILRQIPVDKGIIRPIRVLYVIEGSPGYFGIDTGIVDALKESVKEVYATNVVPNLAKIAAKIRPDLVLSLNVRTLPLSQIQAIRRMGIKTAVWFTDDPYFTDITTPISRVYDYVFTHELSCVAYYRKQGCARIYYLPLGVNPKQFRPKQVSPSHLYDICFIGTAFPNRLTFMDRVAPYLAKKKILIAGGLWQHLKHYPLLKHNIRLAGIRPVEAAHYYSGAKIVINLHRSFADHFNSKRIPALSINPRTYEVSGCGTLLLTDVRQDLTRYYQPGRDIATYSTPESLMQKLDYYLTHEEERRQIAWKALERTMREHTYKNRIAKMLNIIFG